MRGERAEGDRERTGSYDDVDQFKTCRGQQSKDSRKDIAMDQMQT